jgi:hypothetical protein
MPLIGKFVLAVCTICLLCVNTPTEMSIATLLYSKRVERTAAVCKII